MWGFKAKTVPVVVGALGVVKKGIQKSIDKIPGKIDIIELQNIAFLGSITSSEKFYQTNEDHDYPLEPQNLDLSQR